MATIKPYSKREASVKPDEDCTDLTLPFEGIITINAYIMRDTLMNYDKKRKTSMIMIQNLENENWRE